jgi:L-methionine (R)-S-oxide reductase
MHVAVPILEVKAEVERLAASIPTAREFMADLVALLHKRMLKYHWVGFYLLEYATQAPVLVLGPFQGAVTPHTRIPLNQGVCGAAAFTGKTIIVDDVAKDPRYLVCSLETKSEIVVPVFAHSKVVGELDIDSHFPAAFAPADRELVEYCALVVGNKLESSPA